MIIIIIIIITLLNLKNARINPPPCTLPPRARAVCNFYASRAHPYRPPEMKS